MEQKAEPVAFGYSHPNGEWHVFLTERPQFAEHIGYVKVPLYANPQPAAVDGLVRALRPFALVAEHDIGEDESDFDLFKSLSYNHAPRITVGDIRRAHQALTKIKQP